MEENRSGNPSPEMTDVFLALAQKRVYIETYGCSYNFGDTANFLEVLKHYGSIPVSSPEDADAVVINTCTVVGPTERGCSGVSRPCGKSRFLSPAVCRLSSARRSSRSVLRSIIPTERIREAYLSVRTVAPGGVGIVQIAQGCLGRCTYCITRRARGSLVSFPTERSGKVGRSWTRERTKSS